MSHSSLVTAPMCVLNLGANRVAGTTGVSKKKKRFRKSTRRKPTRPPVETPSSAPDASWEPPVPANPSFQVLIILVLVFLAYVPSLSVPMYYDDYYAIVDKKEHQSLEGIKLILREFIHRGIVRLSYALDWHLSDRLDLYETRTAGGLPGYQKSVIYHLSSVAYHLVTVVGVFLLVRKIAALFAAKVKEENEQAGQRPIYLPAVVALLYGILPINTEAATYLSGRSSVLATAEYVFGIWTLLIAAERFGLFDEHFGGRSYLDYIIGMIALFGTLACFVLGIGTKEIIVTMPVVGLFILACLIAHRFSLRTAAIRVVPICALVALLLVGFFAYRIKAFGGNVTIDIEEAVSGGWSTLLTQMIGIQEAQYRPWWVNLLSQIGVISLYYIPRQLGLRPLCIDPEVPAIDSVTHSHVIVGLLILGGLVALGVLCIRRAPLVTIGLAWYFISLAPTSSIIPLNDLAAERRAYLANVGFVLAVVALGETIRQYLQKRGHSRAILAKVFAVVVVCICVFEATRTVQRNLLYTDKIKFWEEAARLSPGKLRVHHHLAKEYWMAKEFKKARDAYVAALDINPYHMDSANNLGIILMKDLKQYDAAARVFEQCVKFWPDWDYPWINLGTCYLKGNKFDKADDVARRWLERDPKSEDARVLMANSLFMQGHLDEAEPLYLEVLKTYGENTTALDNLRSIARRKGDAAAAQEYKRRADAVREKERFKPIEVHGKRDTIQASRF